MNFVVVVTATTIVALVATGTTAAFLLQNPTMTPVPSVLTLLSAKVTAQAFVSVNILHPKWYLRIVRRQYAQRRGIIATVFVISQTSSSFTFLVHEDLEGHTFVMFQY